MSSDTKFFGVVAVFAVAAVVGVVLYSNNAKNNPSTTVDSSNGQKIGSDSATVKIVEFSDFQCPACKAAEPGRRQMLEAHPDDVQFIYRHFPLDIHPNAIPAAQAAEAAGKQGKFWEFHQLLFDRQEVWSGQTNPEATFVNFAKELGLDDKKFRDDYGSDGGKNNIKRDRDYGTTLEVNQTPTFYINNKKVAGAQTFEAWQQLISDAKK